MQAIKSRLGRISPVWLAFFGSLLLSLIAVLGEATVGKDAAFYLDIARQTVEQGPEIATQRFNWPWFPLLLALTHWLGIPLELAAYGWCALFMAGTCALLVDFVRRKVPDAAWWTCLVVLAMPAFNEFRGDILREFGFWFFSVLTIWMAARWDEQGGWWRLLALFPTVLFAALFRLEAAFLLPALMLWQAPALLSRERRTRALQLFLSVAVLAALGLAGLLVLIYWFEFPVLRLVYYANLLTPTRILASFNAFAEQFANSMLYKFSREEAGQIIFFGMIASLLFQAFKLLGSFAVLLFFRETWRKMGQVVCTFAPFAWAALMYFLVLVLFFMQEQFITTRYLSFLNLLLVPLVGLLALLFARSHPRLGRALLSIGLLFVVANVVSFGGRKTHYVEAGHWLQGHVQADSRIYYDDLRISYYAGFGYPLEQAVARETALTDPAGYDYLVIEAKADEPWLQEWLAEHDRVVLAEFANRKRKTVLVIGHAEAQSSPGISSEESPDAAR